MAILVGVGRVTGLDKKGAVYWASLNATSTDAPSLVVSMYAVVSEPGVVCDAVETWMVSVDGVSTPMPSFAVAVLVPSDAVTV